MTPKAVRKLCMILSSDSSLSLFNESMYMFSLSGVEVTDLCKPPLISWPGPSFSSHQAQCASPCPYAHTCAAVACGTDPPASGAAHGTPQHAHALAPATAQDIADTTYTRVYSRRNARPRQSGPAAARAQTCARRQPGKMRSTAASYACSSTPRTSATRTRRSLCARTCTRSARSAMVLARERADACTETLRAVLWRKHPSARYETEAHVCAQASCRRGSRPSARSAAQICGRTPRQTGTLSQC